jgi:protein-L-isoaspartate(D-aspartate) O-methyltransferase
MSWRCSGNSNEELIKNLRKQDLIKHDDVEAAMLAVDRANYCVDDSKSSSSAYADRPQALMDGQTISAPHMHAMCLELLRPHLTQGATVLDVGCGSGYLTTAIAHMVGAQGKVYGIESVSSLVQFSKANVAREDEKLRCRISITEGDGRNGWIEHAPYDCIHVGAAAPKIPKPLMEQLKVGGTLVIPVGAQHEAQYLLAIKRTADDKWDKKVITGVMYVPLTDPPVKRKQNDDE